MLGNQIKIGKKIFTVKKDYLKILRLYKGNKKAAIGVIIKCPSCGLEFKKGKDSHAFCGHPFCKDDFWNKIDPRKRNNNGKNRGQRYTVTRHWCDNDMGDCEHHSK